MDTDRRTMLRLLAAAPAAAGVRVDRSGGAAGAYRTRRPRRRRRRRRGTPFKPKFFNAHEWATMRRAGRHHHPEGRSFRQRDRRRRAGVHGLHDGATSRRARPAMRGGLAWLDRECVNRYDKMFVTAPSAERTQGARRHRVAAKAPPDLSHGVAFFNMLPRSHRQRLLDQQDGHQGSSLHRQRLRARVERLPGRGAEEAGNPSRVID